MADVQIDLSIIIINWNTRQLLLNCINSVYSTVHKATFEIIVVDNGSTDRSVEAVSAAYPGAKVIANVSNLGFAKANNLALRQMRGRYAVLLNSDTILKGGALDLMYDFMERHPEAGMCGPQLLNKYGAREASVGVFPTVLKEFGIKSFYRIFFPAVYKEHFKIRNSELKGPAVVDYIIGACMMVRKSAIDEVGMLDQDYFFCFEEIDWCLRMKKAGWPVYHLPDVEVYHFHGQSVKDINLKASAESWRSRYIYFKKNPQSSSPSSRAPLWMGFFLNVYRFSGYTLANIVTLFMIKSLRKRWILFTYLLVWHLRGRPVSMCIPRT